MSITTQSVCITYIGIFRIYANWTHDRVWVTYRQIWKPIRNIITNIKTKLFQGRMYKIGYISIEFKRTVIFKLTNNDQFTIKYLCSKK